MYHSTLTGPDHGYHLIYIPLCNSTEPYHGVNTHDKEIKLYGVTPNDHDLIEHFLQKADKQYAHEGHHDGPPRHGRLRRQEPKPAPSLEQRIEKAEQPLTEKADATRAA